MRHGRLASALAVAAFTGLAAGQPAPTDFGADRNPLAPVPTAVPADLPLAGGLGLRPVAADAQADKDKKAPPTTDKAPAKADSTPKTIPPTAAGAAPLLAPTTTLPPTAVSVVPPGGVVLGPGGTALFANAGPVDPDRFWVSAEYLWWRIKDDTVPPLVTTGPATFPVGFLGNAGTRVLFGGDIDRGTLNGYRLRAGMWLDACHTVALEASGFWLDKDQDRSTTFSSAQFPVLARPFTDVNPGGPNSEFLAFPGLATGSVTVTNRLEKFCGANLVARCPICATCNSGLSVLGGLQYMTLKEELTVVETPLGSPTNPFPGGAGTQFIATDKFRTENQFFGGLVGLSGYYNTGCLTFGAYGTFAAGCNRQVVDISGSLATIPAGGSPSVQPGGLLALPGRNIGRFTNNEFSTVSEAGVTVGYQLSPNVQIFGGYSVLYWTHVVRPGSEIDPVLDTTRIPNFGGAAPTAARPAVLFNQVDFWARGVSAGVKFSW
jgi:hypothetical protein